MDLDLDAYADDSETTASSEQQPVPPHIEQTEEKHVSVLEAAERAGIPLEELLPKLDP